MLIIHFNYLKKILKSSVLSFMISHAFGLLWQVGASVIYLLKLPIAIFK